MVVQTFPFMLTAALFLPLLVIIVIAEYNSLQGTIYLLQVHLKKLEYREKVLFFYL